MRWFQHFSDAHKNLKLKALVSSYGWESYGLWWILCELCANSGKSEENWCLEAYKEWKKEVRRITGVEYRRLNRILKKMAKVHLIDENELKKGNLSIPQMKEYCDDYTDRVRRVSEQSSKKSPTVHNSTIHNNTRDTSYNNFYNEARRLISKKKEFPK